MISLLGLPDSRLPARSGGQYGNCFRVPAFVASLANSCRETLVHHLNLDEFLNFFHAQLAQRIVE